jgi:putative ABC transport system ATP-binding protein|tara:strand:- start:1700 stop:2383 length:684 start_codon:yes stop_codon:yes gene_type:complete
MTLIRVKNLKKQFQIGSEIVNAIKDISFEVNAGEFISIMGPSGSGKTTLMNIIGCLDTPTSGEYHLDDSEVSLLDDDELAAIRNRKIGFVFQSFHLLTRNTALKNVMLPLTYAGYDKSEATEKAKSVLDKVGLDDRINHKPNELSGGQQQRVAIARALVNNPSIIFADEPTGNLDTKTGEEIMNLFKELHRNGQTIIVITHENEIADQTERIITVKDGLIESDKRSV